jgi:hypothetical protein
LARKRQDCSIIIKQVLGDSCCERNDRRFPRFGGHKPLRRWIGSYRLGGRMALRRLRLSYGCSQESSLNGAGRRFLPLTVTQFQSPSNVTVVARRAERDS